MLEGQAGTPNIPKNKTGKHGKYDIPIVNQKKSKYYIIVIIYLRKEKPRKNSQDFFSLVGLYHDVAFLQGRFNAAQHFTTCNPGITAPPPPGGLQYPRARCRSWKHRHTPGFGTAALEEPEFFARTITSRSQAEVTGGCSRKLTYPTKQVPRQISRGYVIVP